MKLRNRHSKIPGTFDELLSSSEELGNSRFLVTFWFLLPREVTINYVFDLNLTRSRIRCGRLLVGFVIYKYLAHLTNNCLRRRNWKVDVFLIICTFFYLQCKHKFLVKFNYMHTYKLSIRNGFDDDLRMKTSLGWKEECKYMYCKNILY